MNEVQKLKAKIKRRDNKIKLLTKELKNSEKEYYYQMNLAQGLRDQRENYLQSLIEFLGLDDYIKDVVRESI